MNRQSRGLAATVLGTFALIAALTWFFFRAPALVEFAVAVAAAIAWCIWLEKRPDTPADASGRPISPDPRTVVRSGVER